MAWSLLLKMRIRIWVSVVRTLLSDSFYHSYWWVIIGIIRAKKKKAVLRGVLQRCDINSPGHLGIHIPGYVDKFCGRRVVTFLGCWQVLAWCWQKSGNANTTTFRPANQSARNHHCSKQLAVSQTEARPVDHQLPSFSVKLFREQHSFLRILYYRGRIRLDPRSCPKCMINWRHPLR